MTYDKIKYYLGNEVSKFIAELDKTQLLKMKAEIIQDMNLNILSPETLFLRTIELEFINNLLN